MFPFMFYGAKISALFGILTNCRKYLSQFNNYPPMLNAHLRLTLKILKY